MNNQNISDLYKTLTELIEAGDEQVVRDYILDHLKEFPEDVQKKIIFEFFDDAVDKSIEANTQKSQLQKEGLSAIAEIEKVEKTVKDNQKMSNLRSSLGI